MPRSRPRPSKQVPRAARRARAAAESRIRIVVADGQAIDRGGLVGMLEDERDFEVVGEAATVEETIQQSRALGPDVLVLSLGLPGQDHNAAIPAIRAELPRLRILALSERGLQNCLVLNPPSRRHVPGELEIVCPAGTDCLQLAVAQGAMGTLRRSADPEELLRAIRAVAAGGAWYDAPTAEGLLATEGPARRRGEASQGPLSPRELGVAALISEGRSNKEISTLLEISEPTVKKHVGRILAKLGLQDRLQAGLFLARHPLVFRR